jgi:hypothetical protein
MPNEIETDKSECPDVNAHCLQCPGTGWLRGDSKCFKADGRARACPVPEDRGHRNSVVLRPPLALVPVAQAPPPAPESAPREPELASLASFDIFDEVAVARQIRAWYSARHTPRIIAVWLNRFGVPNERASHWYTSHVRALLIREPAPAKRAA